jgi:hypothetical protein
MRSADGGRIQSMPMAYERDLGADQSRGGALPNAGGQDPRAICFSLYGYRTPAFQAPDLWCWQALCSFVHPAVRSRY